MHSDLISRKKAQFGEVAQFAQRINCPNEGTCHSSEISGLSLMKLLSETLQNLPQFWNMKTQIICFVFHFVLLYFFPWSMLILFLKSVAK